MEEEKILSKANVKRKIMRNKSARTNKNTDFTYISYNLELVDIQNIANSWQSPDVKMAESDDNDSTFIRRKANIIDVKSMTNRLTWNEITNFVLDELGVHSLENLDLFRQIESRSNDIVQQWSYLQHVNDVKNSFSKRTPGEKLSPKQLKYIVYMLADQEYNVLLISRNLELSMSLLYKIASMDSVEYERRMNKAVSKIHGLEKIALVKCAEIFTKNRITPYNIKDVQNFVFQKLGKFYCYKTIRDIMKNILHLSFKRWKPRPNSINI